MKTLDKEEGGGGDKPPRGAHGAGHEGDMDLSFLWNPIRILHPRIDPVRRVVPSQRASPDMTQIRPILRTVLGGTLAQSSLDRQHTFPICITQAKEQP